MANRQALTLNQLSQMLGGRGRSSLYRDFKEGRLPQPFKIGARSYVWADEVEQHIATANTEARVRL